MNRTFRDLHLGVQGKDVKLLQTKLRNLGFEISSNEINDGIFGSKTEEAVKKFQERHNLKQTGRVDKQSANKLRDMMKNKTGDKKRLHQDDSSSNRRFSHSPSADSTLFVVQGRAQDADAQPWTTKRVES